MKRYFANMSVNNGTHYRPCWEGTNYMKLARSIARSAKANCFVGNEYHWTVWNENGIIVAAGAGKKTSRSFIHYDCRDLIGERI